MSGEMAKPMAHAAITTPKRTLQSLLFTLRISISRRLVVRAGGLRSIDLDAEPVTHRRIGEHGDEVDEVPEILLISFEIGLAVVDHDRAGDPGMDAIVDIDRPAATAKDAEGQVARTNEGAPYVE